MKKAFSLIELSIVILIIGILIAGVTQSSRLVKKFRISTAQSLTQSSPVNSIKDLVAWWETSLDSSFITLEAQDDTQVSIWYDNNSQSTYKNNAVQATSTNQPKYFEDVINSLPFLRFDGTDNFLTFDGSVIVGTEYTVFVVEQRRAAVAGGLNIFIGGNTTVNGTNLQFGYRTETSITFGPFGGHFNDTNAVGSYTVPTPRIHTGHFKIPGGRSYWLNGGTQDYNDGNLLDKLTDYTGSAIGRVSATPTYFNGDIAEIIIFARGLKTEERTSVETYLSKKYNIKLQ